MALNYKRIPSSQVGDQRLVKVANQAARDAAWDLGLGEMRVQWIKPLGTRKAGWFDQYFDNVIHVSERWARENGPLQTMALTYHECRHKWQVQPARHGRFTGYGLAGVREDDANAYAYRKTGVVLNLAYWFDNKQYYK